MFAICKASLQDYAFVVRERMPDWVKEVIKNAFPRRTEDFSDLRRELQELLNRYKVKVQGRKADVSDGQPSNEAHGEYAVGGGDGGRLSENSVRRAARRRFHEAPDGATTTSLYEVYERPPEIVMLDTADQVQERGLRGRAAEFIPSTGMLFVNGLYEAVERTIDDLEPEYVGQADAEAVRKIIIQAARHALAFRVGKATVFALAKRASEDWNEQDMMSALTKESLSIAGDNYDESLVSVRRNVRNGIKMEKVAA